MFTTGIPNDNDHVTMLLESLSFIYTVTVSFIIAQYLCNNVISRSRLRPRVLKTELQVIK